MGVWKLLQRWLGGGREAPSPVAVAKPAVGRPAHPSQPSGRATEAVRPVAAPPHEAEPRPLRADSAWMVRRDELLDDAGRLAGYRFVVHGDAAVPLQADALAQVLADAGVPAFAERRLALVHLDHLDWARSAALSALATARWVWHVDVSRLLGGPEEWLPALQALRAAGQGVAVCGLGEEGAQHPALAAATHAVLDFSRYSPAALEPQLKALLKAWPNLGVAVEQVPTWADRHWCMAMGARWASGRFLATQDQAKNGRKLNASRLVLLEMLNLIRSDADASALAAVAKRDPGVAVQLLSQANSAQHGLQQAITGLDQAIMVMGRQALYRWVAVAVFRAGGDNPRDATLLEMALSRARFLELVGQAAGNKGQADELFLVGLLSFVDVLLNMSMAELLQRMSLPQAVQDVLVRTEGPHAPHFLLTLAVEKCHVRRMAQLGEELGVAVDELNAHRTAALLWAEEAVR
jgi:EAL and modified HD-GYP domain-containing signal transduction protein